jgi:fumarylacetoacetase
VARTVASGEIDETHDPTLQSWVESANVPGCDFPIQSLPVGAFSVRGEQQKRSGVAIGDYIYEIAQEDLGWYMSLPVAQRRELRREWSRALRKGAPKQKLHRQEDCQMLVPCTIGDYSDFYASIHHATNVGRLFRPDNPLLPNYKHVPIGYHGRASSIVVSGTTVARPKGQLGEGRFGPTMELDYEVEVGCLIGPGNELGTPIPISQARDHMIGLCLLNDWSARDVQRWEYQPLGPFLAKSFATTISPWIVTTEALAPFWVKAAQHEQIPLPYLRDANHGALDVVVETRLEAGTSSVLLSKAFLRDLYWTFPQMIAHQTSNGCNLRPGDLLASGTVSGPEKTSRGCLLELTSKGTDPLVLPDGHTRSFLENGDLVELTAYCERAGFVGIGFGSCTGSIAGGTDD